MSPEAGALLLHQIVPRIASAVPVAVPSVGSEDREELIQDGTAMAAKILINAQRNGKKVTPGNVAYYTVQHLKSGRRTVGFSSVDVLAAGTQLQGRSTVHSLHDEYPVDSDPHEALPVSDLMCRDQDDPSMAAARNLDWQEFRHTQNPEQRRLLGFIAEGLDVSEIARALKSSRLAVRQCMEELRAAVVDYFGDGLMLDACRSPMWCDDLRASREQVACRSERSWQMH